MVEYIEKWPVVDMLIGLENEFQQYKPFHGFEHAMYRKLCAAEIAIGKATAAEVAPVVHGRWDRMKAYCTQYVCSECGDIWPDFRSNYCPNCGARMDGE